MNVDRGPSLVEAATYIDQFRDRLVVVKLGGELLQGGPAIQRIIPQIAVLHQCGLRPIVVHGGGRQVDLECEARGITTSKIGGRRVTTPAVLDVLLEVVAGTLNRAIVDRLRREGVDAIGFADGTAEAVRCVRRPPTIGSDGATTEWGEVGDVVAIDAEPLLPAPGEPWAVPVLASLGTLEDGRFVNVNADAVAGRVASELDSEKLVLLTSVAGVMLSPAAAGPVSELTVGGATELIEQGIVKGGMRAKLEEALAALAAGVPQVQIISGREPSTLLRELFTEEGCGTLIVPDP